LKKKRDGAPLKKKVVGRDAELEAGSSAHYDDPAYYAKTYQRRTEDVEYYAALASELVANGSPRAGPRSKKPHVIEYGCGNGRITLPMARAGARVVGVDLSAPMLEDLRARLTREPEDVRSRVTIVHGDMRDAKLEVRAPLVICPFNALLHLYTREDVERFLARVTEHLAPGGELVFDVSMPQPEEQARDPSRAYHAPRFRYPNPDGSKGPLVRYTERFDYDKLRQVLFVGMAFLPNDGSEGWMTPLSHRQFYPQELEALLHYNGFAIREWFGEFDKSKLTKDSFTILVHAIRRAR
jgi:SAM-dependent methyltransferase